MHPFREKFSFAPGSKTDLRDIPTRDPEAFPGDKSAGQKHLNDLGHKLADLQNRLFAEHKEKILIVLQGMDTSGKNGTVRNVFRNVTPQGVHVASFSRPTREELDHDYLWRIHKCTPGSGEIVIFDRSHYEEVTAVRVNELQPELVWSKRFDHINNFEKMLTDEGTLVIKFLLHISRDEQRSRLQSRLKNPKKHWKFDDSDLIARERWEEYMDAYNDVLQKTSTAFAPWYVIPSDQKWLRNIIVSEIIIDIMDDLGMKFPDPDFDPNSYEI
jgi:PPK2 family polyphosphate:nucleotide phosphotransferase